MDDKLVFLDIETTGLDPRNDEILEVAMIKRTDSAPGADINVTFSLEIDTERASPRALEINRYEERFDELAAMQVTDDVAARLLFTTLRDAIVVANNVFFGLRFIEQFLLHNAFEVTGIGHAFTATPWYYNPLDLKALIAGRLGLGAPPWSTKKLAREAGVPLPDDAHSAFADAAWNRDIYDAVMNYEPTVLPNGSVNPRRPA